MQVVGKGRITFTAEVMTDSVGKSAVVLVMILNDANIISSCSDISRYETACQ